MPPRCCGAVTVWPIAADCACSPVTGDMADYTAQEVTDCEPIADCVRRAPCCLWLSIFSLSFGQTDPRRFSTGMEFAMDGTKTEEDEYLAICGCSGDTMEAAGECSTTGILIAT
jgi:hypothetical protein